MLVQISYFDYILRTHYIIQFIHESLDHHSKQSSRQGYLTYLLKQREPLSNEAF